MGTLIRGTNIKKEFGERVILNKLNFSIAKGSRVGIVGDNGAGKTTLANILTGHLVPEEGNLRWHEKNITIGYLRQSTYYSGEQYKKMLREKEESGQFYFNSKALGIYDIHDVPERIDGLSGGEKTKLAIARIWAERPQLLILDEPTNHMDSEGKQWLIHAIKKYEGTVLIISHDRYFLDATVTSILEIENKTCTMYNGNYTTYKEIKKARYEAQKHAYVEQEKYKHKIEKDIKQLKEWGEKGHRESTKKNSGESKMGLKEKYRARAKKKDKQIKSRIHRLEKIQHEGIEKPKEEQNIQFNFISQGKNGLVLVEAQDILKSFSSREVIKPSSFYIKRGECVGIVGPNGCGKTTLIRLLLGQLQLDSGNLYTSPSAKIAYLSQDVMDMEQGVTVLDMFGIENYSERGKLQTLLTNMGIGKNMVHKEISTLSLGERTRLKVAGMIMNDNNLLILDEPTNHLDLHSREMLEDTLSSYEGSILLVSHDRYLLENLCTKVLSFEEGHIKRYEMDYISYMASKEKKVTDHKDKSREAKCMRIENEMTAILGKLSLFLPNTEEYIALDAKFNNLLKSKKELMQDE